MAFGSTPDLSTVLDKLNNTLDKLNSKEQKPSFDSGIFGSFQKIFSGVQKTFQNPPSKEDSNKLPGGDNWLEVLRAGTTEAGNSTKALGSELSNVSGMFGKLGGVVGLAISGLTQIAEGIQAFIQKLVPFVQALSPSTIELFNLALQNINATIGQAFLPLFNDLIQVFRVVNKVIAPLFEALVPIVQSLADIFSSGLIKVVRVVIDTLQTFIPLLDTLTNAFSAVTEIVLVVVNALGGILKIVAALALLAYHFSGLAGIVQIINVLLQGLNGILTIINDAFNIVMIALGDLAKALNFDFFKDTMKDFNRGIQEVIKSLYVFAIKLAKTFGADSIADAIVKSLEKKADATGKTAAQSASIKDFESLAKEIAVKAAGAGVGGGTALDALDYAKLTLEAAKEARDSTTSLLTDIKNELNKVVDKLTIKDVPPIIDGTPTSFVGGSTVGAVADAAFGNPGDFERGLRRIRGWF